MATPQKKATTEAPQKPKGNISDLQMLEKEYKSNRMDAKKLIALKNKLISLFDSGAIQDDEKEFLKLIMQMDRARGFSVSGTHEEQVINSIEKAECTESCVAKKTESVRHVKQGEIYKFSRDFKRDEFVVYVDYVVQGKYQLSEDIVRKEERGHFPPEDQYPKDRKEIHRLHVKANHFHAWFDIEESEENTGEEEVQYTF